MDPYGPVKKQRSPLWYVALGCGGLLVLILVGMAVAGVLIFRAGKGLMDGITDPTQKAANVQKMLGTTPVGYYPLMTLSIPLVMDVALLGDKEPLADGGVATFDRGFMYFRVSDDEESNGVKDFFDGKNDDPLALQEIGVNLEVEEILRRGVLQTVNGTPVKYVATRGTMETKDRSEGRIRSGLNTVMYFDCPGDTAVRLGVWMMKGFEADLPADQRKLEGTVADEGEMMGLIKPLTPCGK